jgi:hypothetical protein
MALCSPPPSVLFACVCVRVCVRVLVCVCMCIGVSSTAVAMQDIKTTCQDDLMRTRQQLSLVKDEIVDLKSDAERAIESKNEMRKERDSLDVEVRSQPSLSLSLSLSLSSTLRVAGLISPDCLPNSTKWLCGVLAVACFHSWNPFVRCNATLKWKMLAGSNKRTRLATSCRHSSRSACGSRRNVIRC